jgi:hypothetical protein
MENNFTSRLIKVTFLMASAIALWMFYLIDLQTGLGILIGASWGSLNVHFLKMLLEEYLKLSAKSSLKISFYLGVKFPLLYFLGYKLLKINLFSVFSLLIGFSLLFIAIFMLGIVNIISENRKRKLGSSV